MTKIYQISKLYEGGMKKNTTKESAAFSSNTQICQSNFSKDPQACFEQKLQSQLSTLTKKNAFILN